MLKQPKIVTIGGGSGAPTIIRSLIVAGFTNISAISTATDSGGRSGLMRTDERDRIISIGDLFRNLLALISPSQNHLAQVESFIDLANFTDGRYRNLGYQIYYALLEKNNNDFLAVQKHLEKLLGIRLLGTAIPVTLESAHISFSTQSGNTYHGEHELDRQSMSANIITRIWLDHPVSATPQAIRAIQNATHIIFCPGSIYGSLLVNFLPKGIASAFKKTDAKKIYISNLVSDRNQTHQFTPLEFFHLFSQYTTLTKPFDMIISPSQSRAQFEKQFPKVAENYAYEHSFFLGWDKSDFSPLQDLGVSVIQAPIWSITPTLSRIRHDPTMLSKVLRKILFTK